MHYHKVFRGTVVRRNSSPAVHTSLSRSLSSSNKILIVNLSEECENLGICSIGKLLSFRNCFLLTVSGAFGHTGDSNTSPSQFPDRSSFVKPSPFDFSCVTVCEKSAWDFSHHICINKYLTFLINKYFKPVFEGNVKFLNFLRYW